MKRYISRVFSLLVAATLLFASESYSQCGGLINGEASVEPPAGWQLPGFQPNTLQPLTGTKSYRTNGFYSDQVYTIKSPVFNGPVTTLDVINVSFQYAINTAFFKSSPTSTPDPLNTGTWHIYVKFVDLTNSATHQIAYLNGALLPNTPKTTVSLNGPASTMITCTDGSCDNRVKYYIEITCISTNYHNSISNWIKFDEVSVFNGICNLGLPDGPTIPGVSLSVQNTQENAGSVQADLNLFKDAAQLGSVTQHNVSLFAVKKQLSDDAVVSVDLAGTISVAASSGTSNTPLTGYLVNDGTYYYEYYVVNGQDYAAQNNVFPKIEQSAPPLTDVTVANSASESVVFTHSGSGEAAFFTGGLTDIYSLETGAQYAVTISEGTSPSLTIKFKSLSGTVLRQVGMSSYPTLVTVPADTRQITIEY